MRINALIFSRPLDLVIMAGMIPGGDRSPRVKFLGKQTVNQGHSFLRKAGFPAAPEFC